MGKYDTAKLRNLGIVAHGGAGKTSLAEAILYTAGMIDRLGRVDDGTSTMDFEPEEIKRKITISSSLDHCEWNGHSLHIVDTPGYGNFIADTRACMRALGGCVVILSAISGVKVQTEEVWEWANEFELPRIAFVNKMDREYANFLRAIDDMEKSLKARGVAVQMPLGAAETFEGVIDLITMKAYRYAKDTSGTFTEEDIPAEYRDEAQRLREHLVETVAEAYDGLTEKYLETGELTEEEQAIMRRHPEHAWEMLKGVDFLRPALDIPYAHHERWDGLGYPRGLSGAEIPLAARLFAVVDVWDALRYDRAYRAGWPAERVREHLREGAGTQFDPAVVPTFLRILERDGEPVFADPASGR